jgi:DNA-binding transcriptional ArsR family regulator
VTVVVKTRKDAAGDNRPRGGWLDRRPGLTRSAVSGIIGNHMVTNNRRLDLTFGALADPTRRAILGTLANGDATVGELARPFDVSRPAISKHLRVLERAGLVHRSKDGRVSRCGLDAKPMRDAALWVERYRTFWEQRFDSLSRYLEQDEPQKEGNHKEAWDQ